MPDLIYSIWLGLVAGVIPVYLGLIPLPLFRKLSASRRNLLISFSAGILLFLFADVTVEAAELAASASIGPILYSIGLIFGLASPAVISYTKRRNAVHAESSPVSETAKNGAKFLTAYTISMGIGLHNFGEGLALGSAYASSQFALTTVLVIGFALHNGTEGIGIAGPVSNIPLRIRQPLLLGFIAGFPTVLGSLVGSVAYSDLIGALFFSAAAGALLYVIVELLRISYSPKRTFVGIVIGILLMYFTGLLVSV